MFIAIPLLGQPYGSCVDTFKADKTAESLNFSILYEKMLFSTFSDVSDAVFTCKPIYDLHHFERINF